MKVINMYRCQICGNIIEETSNTDDHESLWGYVNYKSTHRLPESDRLCVPEDQNHIGLAYYIGSKKAEESSNYIELHRGLTLEERRDCLCINIINDSDPAIVNGTYENINAQYDTIHNVLSQFLASIDDGSKVAFGLFCRELHGLDINKLIDIIKFHTKDKNINVLICNDFRIIQE